MSVLRLTIGMKLSVGFGLVVLLIVGSVFVGLNGLTTVVRTYGDEVERIIETSEVDARRFIAAVVERQEYYTHLGRRIQSENLDEQSEEYEQLASDLVEAREALNEAIAELASFQSRQLIEVHAKAEAEHANALRVMIGFAVIAALGGVVVAVFLTRTISLPVRRATNAALRLAEGDLTLEQLKAGSRDELSDMVGAFNRMVSNLRTIIKQIRHTSTALLDNGRTLLAVAEESSAATGQISAAVDAVAAGTDTQVNHVQETRSAMEQLRRAIDQIATGAQDQAERAEQTTRSLEQMAQSIQQVSQSAEEVAKASGHGANRARGGGEAVDHVVEGMNQIKSSVSRVAERIDELGDYSRQIDQIIQMISDIADQTNLLALNAAIEAARAGEHGRGFGVVAEEVRHLAERSAESTREISQLIVSIQTAVDAAVEEMQAGTEHVETGTDLAGNARAALDEIIKAISTTDGLAQTISEAAAQMEQASPDMLQSMAEMASVTEENTAATEEMAASSEQVLRSMDEVVTVSTETAAATEQVSASTEEVNAASEDMKTSVETLTKSAEDLEQLVRRFQL